MLYVLFVLIGSLPIRQHAESPGINLTGPGANCTV